MLRIKSVLSLLLVLAICLSGTTAARAQSVTATLTGVVKDEQGGLVPGAKVTAMSTENGLLRKGTTNDDGSFNLPLLPPSTYTVSVERDGFAPVEVKGVVLNTNDKRHLDIQMKVSGASESMTVTGTAEGIEVSAAVSTTVDRKFIENMPLNGRTLQSLLLLTPGVVVGGGDGQLSVNGQRTNANYFTIDGASANVGVTRGGTVNFVGNIGTAGNTDQNASGANPGFNSFGGTNSLISLEALEEFKVQTSTYSASFGRQPGGQVQLTSRAGANQYHGALFEYFRNDVLDATDWFTNALQLAKPPLRQNDFGGVLGGPVRLPKFFGPLGYDGRDKTFFFFSYEGLRLAQPQPTIERRVPAAFLHNDTALHPLLQAIIAAYPLPTRYAPTDPEGRITGTGFFADATSSYSNLDALSLRIDQTIGPKHSIFGRYNQAPSYTETFILASRTTSEINTRTFTVGARSAFTSRLLNEATFNYTRLESNGFGELTNRFGVTPYSADLLLPPGAPANASGAFSLPGFVTSLSVGRSRGHRQIQYNIVENLTWVTGSHELRFGVDYRRLTPVYAPRELGTLFQLTSLAALTNPATKSDPVPSLIRTFAADRVKIGLNNFSAYAQDSWRATPRLTLEMGLRWELNPPPRVIEGAPFAVISGLDLENFTLLPAGTDIYPTNYKSFAPRLSAAYLLRDKPFWQTMLRGGYGLFYDLGIGTVATSALQFPNNRTYTAPRGLKLSDLPEAFKIPERFNLSSGSQFPGQDFTYVPPDYVLPRTHQWSLTVEQALGKDQTLTLSYVGNAGRRLLRRYFGAGSPDHPVFPVARLTVTRNDPGLGDESDYKALQMQLVRRLSRGLQVLANYTLSSATDTGSDDASINLLLGNNAVAPAFYRGNSAFDRRHIFNAAVTYEFPTPDGNAVSKALLRGWATDFNFKYQSAAPLSVRYLYTDAQDIIYAYRADVVPGVPVWLEDPGAPGGRRLNPDAFKIPDAALAQIGKRTVEEDGRPAQVDTSQFNHGNQERNSIRGFDLWQLDFVLRRTFRLSERVSLQLRAEFFNVFNHPNFAPPSDIVSELLGDTSQPGVPLIFVPIPNFGEVPSLLGRYLSQGGSSFNAGALSQLYQTGGPRSVQFALKLTF